MASNGIGPSRPQTVLDMGTFDRGVVRFAKPNVFGAGRGLNNGATVVPERSGKYQIRLERTSRGLEISVPDLDAALEVARARDLERYPVPEEALVGLITKAAKRPIVADIQPAVARTLTSARPGQHLDL